MFSVKLHELVAEACEHIAHKMGYESAGRLIWPSLKCVGAPEGVDGLQYASDAISLIRWCKRAWLHAAETASDLESGKLPQLSEAEFIRSLPVFKRLTDDPVYQFRTKYEEASLDYNRAGLAQSVKTRQLEYGFLHFAGPPETPTLCGGRGRATFL